jgi:hypothetical protein
MSNYVKSTNFAAKDNLPKGDPLKVVKGTELDVEFNAIATSIISKANNVSPTFTGTPFAPTATPGTATTQIATTAFVDAVRVSLLNTVYPVGSIYTNATNSTNPGTLLGFGTWVAFGAGRVPVGFNASDALFNAAEKTGGSKDAIVVSHNHTFSATTSTAGAHFHRQGNSEEPGVGGIYGQESQSYTSRYNETDPGTGVNRYTDVQGSHNHTVSGTTSTAGSSGTNANLQPFITVYLWKRTA